MPGLDKSGPMGQGAQTGRRMGRCKTGSKTTNEISYGRGLRRGLGKKLRFENEEISSDQPNRFFRRRRGKI